MTALNPSPITLYHGTSSLFLGEIRRIGLGGQNVLAAWRFYNLIRELAPLCSEQLDDFDNYIFAKMVAQANDHLNFQHGQVYLTPSRATAARYAASNAYGSELVSEAMTRVKRLAESGCETDALLDKYPEARRLMNQSFQPVLISIPDAARYELLTERGKGPDRSIAAIRETLETEPDKVDIYHQQDNFRLTSVVPFEELAIHGVFVTGWSSGFPAFEIVPWENLPDTALSA